MNKKTVLVTVLVTMLAGCKMNVTPELYISDLREVVENSTTGLMTPAAIAVEVPSTKKCDEYTAKIGNVLSGILENYEMRGCTRDGMDSWLNLETQIPIVHISEIGTLDTTHPSLALFGIFVGTISEGGFSGRISTCLYVNGEKYRLLNERMRDTFRQGVDLADSAIGILLNNDEKDTVKFYANGVFLNGEPVNKWKEFSLERRRSAELIVSNVGAAALATEGGVCPLALEI